MEEKEQLPLLTASRLRDARACQRRHKHRYIDRYAPLEDVGPLRFGQMFHRGLEAWWNGEGEARLTAALDTIPPTADPFENAMVRALLTGYDSRWSESPIKAIVVEHEFRVPLINPETAAPSRTWQLGGKCDAITRDEHGRVLLVEHKTTSDDITPGSEYWKRLRLDGQVSIYFQGARAAGYEVSACLYDVIRKPLLRPFKATPIENRKFKKDGTPYADTRMNDETSGAYFERLCNAIAEDPVRYFARGEVVRLETEMDEAGFDIWNTALQIRAGMVANRYPRNPDSCVHYGRTCAFFGVCSGEQRLDDTLLFRRLDNVHPELSQTV